MADKYETRECWKCGGTGRYAHFGECFACGGSGKKRWNLSAEKRRETTEKNREIKRAENVEILKRGDLSFLLNEDLGNGFLVDIREKFLTYGNLSEKQIEAAKKSYEKDQAYKARRAKQEAEWAARDAKSGFIGELKQRLEFVVKLEFVKSFDTQFGISTLHKFRDAEGNILTWFSSSGSDVTDKKGQEIRIKGTVKKHEEYKGTKQTVISRVKYLGSIEEKNAEGFISELKSIGGQE